MNLVEVALSAKEPAEALAGRPWGERAVLHKFRFNLKAIALRPTVLVSYERQAWLDPDDVRSRITFDSELRSLWHPDLRQLFEERGASLFDRHHWILELKFDDRMPRWMCDLVRRLELRVEPYSKYCHGIYAWKPHDVVLEPSARALPT
jgi:SPX domain protein involved in polyphosphate accumulation